MPTFKIILKRNEDIAREILKGWQLKVFLVKQRSFISIIKRKLSKYDTVDKGDKVIFSEYNENIEYLEKQKKELEDFLYSDSSKLGSVGSEEFQALKNDRIIQKVSKTAHRVADKVKQSAIKKVIGSEDVLTFFLKLGISIDFSIDKNG